MTCYRILCVLTSILLITATAFGQASTSIRGTVSDPQGGVIGGGVLELVGEQTGFKRSIVTDERGAYQFSQVPPGTYVLVAQMTGFAVVTHTGVDLLVDTPTRLDVKMEVATVAETVNVEADAATFNAVDATIGNAFSQTQVRQLPLQTRNVVELLSLQPGVTPSGEVAGARRDQNNISLDGADVNNNQNSGLMVQNSNTFTGGFQGSNANGAVINSGF